MLNQKVLRSCNLSKNKLNLFIKAKLTCSNEHEKDNKFLSEEFPMQSGKVRRPEKADLPKTR